MSLKKVFSTIAVAAIAVGGLAIGASTASADEATFGNTITLTERKTVTYTATRTAGANPNLTWISVQRR